MSEKLDGVRALWDGFNLKSRNGKLIDCPDWFTSQLGKCPLDGELYIGRNSLENLNSLLNSGNSAGNPAWNSVKFHVFDLPESKDYFENRILNIREISLPAHVEIVPREKCSGNGHLLSKLESIVAVLQLEIEKKEGGEGLMVNQPYSQYVPHRTDTLLKIKVNI
jgi:DNA ligase 1